jgi:hypothetical protein
MRVLSMRLIALATILVVITSCSCLDRSLPGFDVSADSLLVVLYDESQTMPRDCTVLGAVTAEDGMMGSARWSYDGTRERAIAKIKDAASRMGGNAVKLDGNPKLDYIGLDGARGSIMVLSGTALKCPK